MLRTSNAFLDYTTRMREAVALLRLGLRSAQAEEACACSKGATVLAAAALERYINDAVSEACQSLRVSSWDELSEGYRHYLCQQIARRLSAVGESLVESDRAVPVKEQSLKKLLAQCGDAFADPSTWPHHPRFGMFMESAAAPDKVMGTLSPFVRDKAGFLVAFDGRVWDHHGMFRALQQLVDARHGVAHALPEAPQIGPKDVQNWLVTSYWLARRIRAFLFSSATSAPA